MSRMTFFCKTFSFLATHFCRTERQSCPAARLEAQPVREAFTLVQKVRFLMPGQVLWVCCVWRVCLGPTPHFQTSPQPHSILPRFVFHTSARPSPPRTALPHPSSGGRVASTRGHASGTCPLALVNAQVRGSPIVSQQISHTQEGPARSARSTM